MIGCSSIEYVCLDYKNYKFAIEDLGNDNRIHNSSRLSKTRDGKPHHPECPERIQAINDQLIRSGMDLFSHHLDAPLTSEDQLELVHSPDHVSFVRDRAPETGYFMLDGDTIMNPHTYRASLRAAGAAIAGVDAVIEGGS